MLLIVLISDASQNAMIGDANSWPNGVVLVATLIGWNYLLDWLTYYSPRFRKLMEPEPTLLISMVKCSARTFARRASRTMSCRRICG
jgi:uncharacterized membrane protein YcaP (DUF421 family)